MVIHSPLAKHPADDKENHRQRNKDNTLKFEFHDELPPLKRDKPGKHGAAQQQRRTPLKLVNDSSR
jgi:hypothetical protein